ncbi:hypothetical protein JRO89_XS04G0264300 [Xanthoceras sorbifolium]|uniref:Uncharacterized protein n=1 Tax=Xanthoceras sorbifolium TaxID=99658 RepID=A0ABQ8I782_9ROSI|nr:hypothetical protein JRO89_XS04G0264300 [Xanthoceras sorbifolium]
MAYVDHAFSISDEDIMMETSYTVNNRPPIKEIGLAISLLVFGTVGIICGIAMAYNRVGGDRAHEVRGRESFNIAIYTLKPSLVEGLELQLPFLVDKKPMQDTFFELMRLVDMVAHIHYCSSCLDETHTARGDLDLSSIRLLVRNCLVNALALHGGGCESVGDANMRRLNGAKMGTIRFTTSGAAVKASPFLHPLS